jgi:hypothetical protein
MTVIMDYLQGSPSAGASANGNGSTLGVGGLDTAQQIEVAETNGGTCTRALQGSFDGTNWYAIGYQQVDNTASPARAVANISVTANSRHVYQLLDPYLQVRAVISSVATSPSVTVRLYAV